MKTFINKGNYSLDTPEREELFDKNRAFGFEDEYYKYRKQWEAFAQRKFVSDYPLLVDLELSTVCNLNCRFCYTSSKEYKEKVKAEFMDFGLFKKIIDEIGGKVFAVRLSLRGEPTINPDFVKAIKYAKDHGIKEVSTLTNGSKLTPAFFEQIMYAGIDWITLSFDGIGGEYEKNRAPLEFDFIYAQLEKIKEIKKRENRVKPVIKIQSIWPAISANPQEYYETMSKVCDLVAFNPLIDFERKNIEITEFEENFSCPQLYQRLVIGANGLVMLCANDEQGECIVGDANKETVYSVWHGSKINAAREIHMHKDGFKKILICRKCYLPRKTRQDTADVGGRTVFIQNYT